MKADRTRLWDELASDCQRFVKTLHYPQHMDDSLQRLFDAVLAARARDPALSRTSKLFQDGIEKIAKKLAEEAVEVGIDAVLMRRHRTYWCQREGDGVLIRNDAGEQILWRNQESNNAADEHGAEQDIRASHPYLQALFRDAAVALGITD